MKIIDLLNKIANGEEVPKKIKFGKDIFTYNKERNDYIHEIDEWVSETLLFKVMCTHFIKEILESEVELIEEQEDIDVQAIKELNLWCPASERTLKINELIQAVKQLDRKMKEG